MPMIKDFSFEQWLSHVFDHPEQDKDWHLRPGRMYWRDAHALKAAYIAETFENADRHLARFSDGQLENALWFLLTGDYLGDATGADVPLDASRRVIRSTADLFRKLFAVRCTDVDLQGARPLYCACYMFWEMFPVEDARRTPVEAALLSEKLAVLRGLLAIPNVMCQYSALHGLGHVARREPAPVAELIDEFLGAHPEPDFVLRTYALAARRGGVE